MFAASKTASVSGGYQISRSLRFNEPDTTYLNRGVTSTGNRRTYTFSAWVKRSKTGSDSDTIIASMPSGAQFRIFFETSTYPNQLRLFSFDGSFQFQLITTQVFRDFSAWGHLVVAIDTTQATASNRVRVYWNGVEITSFGTSTYPSQNADLQFNQSGQPHSIGGTYNGSSTSGLFNGYITEFYFVDGSQLTPSSFGETNADTGVWQPKAYSGSYGTNGFYLNFSDNSNTTAATLGADYSGNGNNWTPNNFSVTAGAGNDSLVDSPTSYGVDTGVGGTVRGNYATINPFQLISNVSVSNGNLYLQSNNNQDQFASAPSTVAARTGKWYAEYTAITVAGTPSWQFGVARASWSPIILDGGSYYGRWYYTSEGYSYSSNSNFYTNNATVGTGATYTNGDIIGIALNLDAGSIAFYKNGVLQGTPFTSITLGVDYVFAGGAFTTPYPTPTNIAAFFANYGQRPFAYTAPSGFKALCTQNLPTPTIGATTATQAGKYFNTVLYTGNGTTQTISGVGFQPDLVWCKGRSNAFWHSWIDAVRGRGFASFSNTTNAEFTSPVGKELTAFTSDGFSLGPDDGFSINSGSAPFVAWNWKANGAGSTNTAGSITSTVSANTTSGFSVVTYTGNGGTNQSIGHGLGATPGMVIIKNRTIAANWLVHHQSQPTGYTLYLNLTNEEDSGTSQWGTSAQTSTLFYVGFTAGATGSNKSGDAYVAYCFAPIAGYSAFGSYDGNGSADGPFVYTGFRPAFVLFKRTNATSDWWMYDTKRSPSNEIQIILWPNYADAEATGASIAIDILSNGFKPRSNNATFNGSGGTYIYMAFASNPFKYSLAR